MPGLAITTSGRNEPWFVGSRVGELIAEGQLIDNWDAEPSDIAKLIHPHPTQSEIIGEAHLALAGKPLHFHA